MTKLFNHTLIGWLNIIILQWFFTRLYWSQDDQGNVQGYGFLFPVVPLTGWWSDYIPQKQWKVKL